VRVCEITHSISWLDVRIGNRLSHFMYVTVEHMAIICVRVRMLLESRAPTHTTKSAPLLSVSDVPSRPVVRSRPQHRSWHTDSSQLAVWRFLFASSSSSAGVDGYAKVVRPPGLNFGAFLARSDVPRSPSHTEL
jgi:hypothetical protein